MVGWLRNAAPEKNSIDVAGGAFAEASEMAFEGGAMSSADGLVRSLAFLPQYTGVDNIDVGCPAGRLLDVGVGHRL